MFKITNFVYGIFELLFYVLLAQNNLHFYADFKYVNFSIPIIFRFEVI